MTSKDDFVMVPKDLHARVRYILANNAVAGDVKAGEACGELLQCQRVASPSARREGEAVAVYEISEDKSDGQSLYRIYDIVHEFYWPGLYRSRMDAMAAVRERTLTPHPSPAVVGEGTQLDPEAIADAVIERVVNLDEYTSPDDCPDLLMARQKTLHFIVADVVRASQEKGEA